MISQTGKRRVSEWTCDHCGNIMLSAIRPKRCTRASCRKVADYQDGITKAGRPRILHQSPANPSLTAPSRS